MRLPRRADGYKTLIGTLGFVEAKPFLATISRDKFDYTEWRRTGPPSLSIDEIALAANKLLDHIDRDNLR